MHIRPCPTPFALLSTLALAGLLLSGCAHTQTAPPTQPGNDVTTAANPYPDNPAKPIPTWARADEVAALQHEMASLRQQVAEIQQQQTALSQLLSARTALASAPTDTATPSSSRLQQAQQQYRAGLYAQAVRSLAGADGGGNGDAEAQSSMYLLLQSHHRLNNCESVINIGNRFAGRFARNPQAAEALWLVGQCQWQMQQQDIARDTWRKIIRTYPDSAAAKRAAQRLK